MQPLNKFEKELLNQNRTLFFAFLVIKRLRGVSLNSPNEHLKWEAELLNISNYKVSKRRWVKHILDSYGIVETIKYIYRLITLY